jgi:hypothetical protein
MERFARLAPNGVLVADAADDPAVSVARTQLLAAGFTDVSVLGGTDQQQARAAA